VWVEINMQKKVLHLEGLGFYFNQARLTSSGALIRSASRM
jgi:hypothetical protein